MILLTLDTKRDLFLDFSQIFAEYIPREKIENKAEYLLRIQGARCEENNPRAIYCYDVRRNGRNDRDEPNRRSIENSNKAQSLRPELYERYKEDLNLSFFFSENLEDERTNEEIIRDVARRR